MSAHATAVRAGPDASGPDRPGRAALRRFGAVLDFRHLELLTALRLSTGLRPFQTALGGAVLLGFALLAAASAAAFALANALLAEHAASAQGLLVVLGVANLYAGGGYLLREAFSGRRFQVSNSPNTAFFRALDLSARDVLVVYCGIRITGYFAAVAVVDAMFLAAFAPRLDPSAATVAAVLAVPAAAWAATNAVAARSARRSVRPAVHRPWAVPGLVALAFAAAWATSALLVEPMLDAGPAAWLGRGDAGAFTTALALASAAVGAAALIAAAVDVRRLSAESFPIQQVPPARAYRGAAPRSLIGVLAAELRRSPFYVPVRRSVAVAAAVLAAGLGALASGAAWLPLQAVPDRTAFGIAAVALATALGTAELTLRAVGPVTYSAQYRFAYEAGRSSRSVALAAVAVCALPAALMGIVLDAAAAVAAGAAAAPGAATSAAAAAAAAALVAETTTRPPRNADGTLAPNLVGAVLAMVLAAPVLLPFSSALPAGRAMAGAYTICLLGGAFACVERRIRALPSTSST
ncbi:hypothetical protein LO763_19155 [Glycomyces sp. A-F 0318]|uniref:hypothetical protein n=1 Tax=Glycomyces amatae TaxID=2881355 RepID=UPI001E6347E8|nr:hypothetical protein [Glycomyces amatae]MCD0445730.1 hypothetical protein [Glycomyces amatae]